jgi:hypothetical protein
MAGAEEHPGSECGPGCGRGEHIGSGWHGSPSYAPQAEGLCGRSEHGAPAGRRLALAAAGVFLAPLVAAIAAAAVAGGSAASQAAAAGAGLVAAGALAVVFGRRLRRRRGEAR